MLMAQTAKIPEGNDTLMRSLPELSRETGIPMPVILRLKRENPEEIPSVGAGSQQFFPEGVAPILRGLYLAEERDGALTETVRPLRSIARRRQEAVELSRQLQREAGDGRGSTEITPEDQENRALAAKLTALERSQLALAGEVRRLLQEIKEPWTGEFELLQGPRPSGSRRDQAVKQTGCGEASRPRPAASRNN